MLLLYWDTWVHVLLCQCMCRYMYVDRLMEVVDMLHVQINLYELGPVFCLLHPEFVIPPFSPPTCECLCFFCFMKNVVRCWCFIRLTKPEWCCITKSLLKGWGLSIITAAAFMFSLASASLLCHCWPFVPYQRRLWSSGSAETHWQRLAHTHTYVYYYFI